MRTRALSLLVPAVLVAIAALQLTLAHAQSLTPWKGGGFGMFSTVDSRNARFLRNYALTADGEVPVRLPKGATTLAREARSLPTHARLQALADALAAVDWVSADDDQKRARIRARARHDQPGRSHPVRGIRVEYWRYAFDAPATSLRAARLDQVTVASRREVKHAQ